MSKYKNIAFASVLAISAVNTAHALNFDSPVGAFNTSLSTLLANDYIWRGQSQTNGATALQGSLNISHESGAYLGVWASNVDDDTFTGNKGGANAEINYYVGYAGQLTETLGYDLSWISYDYPGASTWNYEEWKLSLSAHGFTLTTKYAYDSDIALYVLGSYKYQLPYGVMLGASYGFSNYKTAIDGANGDEKYKDWSLSLTKNIASVDFSVTYSDTDMDNAECYNQTGHQSRCDGTLTMAISKTFD